MEFHEIGRPSDYGLPEKFAQYRPAQIAALSPVYDSLLTMEPPPQFRGLQMIVGSGKTGVYITLHQMRRMANPNHRTAIIVMTKGLQDQIVQEFEELGVADIRGKANYRCPYWGDCDVGHENDCPASKTSGCAHWSAYQSALNGSLIVTNLACWVASYKFGEGLGGFDTLVIDEAHALLGGLTGVTTLTFSPSDGPRGVRRLDMSAWKKYAEKRLSEVKEEIKTAKGKIARRKLQEAQQLGDLIALNAENYVIDVDSQSNWATIAPIWPADMADDLLYHGTKEVLLLSGTLMPRSLDLVGASPHVFDSYLSDFDPATWPIQLVDVGNVDSRMSAGTKAAWAAAHIKVLQFHPDIKGIIHPVSYLRAEEIKRFIPSDMSKRIITHRSGETEAAVRQFRTSPLPKVLASPAVTTGYDFPIEDVGQDTFAIISKMPRPNFSQLPNLRRARRERYAAYDDYEMMNTFSQSIGRTKRSADQRCAVYVLDSHARHLLPRHRGELVPEWVYNLVVWGDKRVRSPRRALT